MVKFSRARKSAVRDARRRRAPAGLVTLLLLLLGTGCTYTRLTRCAGDLTRQELEQGGLAFGGVTALGGGESEISDYVAERVEKRFHATRPWLVLSPLENVRQSFGPEYQAALKRISEGDWAPTDLAEFNHLTNHTRYVLLVNINVAIEDQGWYERESWGHVIWKAFVSIFNKGEDSKSFTDEDEDDESNNVQINYSTLRAEANFGIFDLQTRTMVWLAGAESKLRETDKLAANDPAADTATAPMPALSEAMRRMVKLVATQLPN